MVNKNDSFVLHELFLLICLWLSGQGTKSQMQYRSVFTENFQQSEIKKESLVLHELTCI